MFDKLKITLRMIKFEHTVFALPFALIALLLAADGLPSPRQIFWVVAAMVGARSAAMTFNRITDLDYDRRNPRTRNRDLPTGRLSLAFAAAFTIASSALFVLSAWMLNRLCGVLSIPTLAVLMAYSYTKRFTSLSHLFLGLAIGLAPPGAWLAIRGELAWTPVLLGAAVMLWIAGFDIIYSCQDADVDRRLGLFSLPSRFGLRRAFQVSGWLHAGTAVLLLATARLAGLGALAYAGIGAVAAILYWEHRIVGPEDMGRIDVAFFNLNGYVSLLLLAAVAADIWVF